MRVCLSVVPDDDAISETPDYRYVVSRDGAGWVGTVYGPGLPESGETVKGRNLKQLQTAAFDVVLRFSVTYVDDNSVPCTVCYGMYTEYDFGPAAAAALASFKQADEALIEATENHTRHGHQAAKMLARKHNATVAEIAEILTVTRQEAARLVAPPVRHHVVLGWGTGAPRPAGKPAPSRALIRRANSARPGRPDGRRALPGG